MTKVFISSNDELSCNNIVSFSNTRRSKLNVPSILITDYEEEILKAKDSVPAPDSINKHNHGCQTEFENNHTTAIVEINDAIVAHPVVLPNNGEDNWESTLEAEEQLNKRKSEKRNTVFESIILNRPSVFSAKTLIFYTLGISLTGFLLTLPLTIIPAHDILQSPSYWYEILFHGAIGVTAETIRVCLVFGDLLNINYIRETRNVISVSLVGNLAMVLFVISTRYGWTQILHLQYPIPFHGVFSTHILFLVYPITIWLLLPVKWRQNSELNKRMKFLAYLSLYTTAALWINIAIITILRKSNKSYQPLFALALPVMREFNLWISNKLAEKCSNKDNRKTTIIVTYSICARYTISLCNVIGFTTDTTTWVLIGVDFSLNIWLCLRIIWLRKRRNGTTRDQIRLLQELVIFELVEFHAPVSFILVLIVAYFGPNGHLYGNILNSYWTYIAIEDVGENLKKMCLFFSVDFASTIASAIILWLYCKINMFKAFIELQKEFSVVFSIILSTFLILVC